ncbi:MAG: hypothetical protein KF697_15995 [Pseudolabrys sp.]|nr:hypothetical protein [Pseudolabrys sp.]
MKRSNGSRAIWAAAAMMMAVVWLPAEAVAQVSIDAGKSPQQVFASDCQACHKDARTLSKGPTGLAAFLREHYTASRESAKAMADYLVRIGTGGRDEAPAARRRGREPAPEATPAAAPGEARPARTRHRGEVRDDKADNDKPKSDKSRSGKSKNDKSKNDKPQAKPADAPAEVKPAETKPVEAAPVEAKPVETKPAEKPAEPAPVEKPADVKPAEIKPAETKPAETTKPADAPPAESKSTEPKPAAPAEPAKPAE